MLTVSALTQLELRLAAIAKKTERTKSHHARKAIAEHFVDFEYYYFADARQRKTVVGNAWAAPCDGLAKRLSPKRQSEQ
ncbi:MAG: hypothetical protein ACRCV9_05680 [Burkholderiaceae bacterium]